ncbi:hypothetical protein PSH03_001402 [Micromonospora sp. PSH03]|uniref:hypothetical protein n=1 Tax=Micromonospora salmantinae TaxID=2911211 RepID=UPI001EE94077|nr:hypothetical protein [Micromonospora salmantinae]MCG5456502.1 hypothetical protein [Micromonospora salmantinae]
MIFDFDGVLLRGDASGLFLRRTAFAGARLPLAVAALVLLAPIATVPALARAVLDANARQVTRARRLLGARLTTVTWFGGQGPGVPR